MVHKTEIVDAALRGESDRVHILQDATGNWKRNVPSTLTREVQLSEICAVHADRNTVSHTAGYALQGDMHFRAGVGERSGSNRGHVQNLLHWMR